MSSVNMKSSVVSFEPLAQKKHIILQNAVVQYEPSVYGGDGSENRVNLVLEACSESAVQELLDFENSLNLDRCMSAVKPDGAIRSKLVLDEVRLFDSNHTRMDKAPLSWRGAVVNAKLEIRGTWKTRTGSGLSLLCTDVQFMQGVEGSVAISPFLDCAMGHPIGVH